MKVVAVRVEGYEQAKDAGDFFWGGFIDGKPSRMNFLCPCGCGVLAGISVKPADPNGWDWDGDLVTPTTKPSILIDRGHWHGYLTAGVFEEC